MSFISASWIITLFIIFTGGKASTCLSSPREPRVFGLSKFYWPYKSQEVLMRPFIRSAWSVSPSFHKFTLVCSSSCFFYYNFSQRRWSVWTMAHPAPPDLDALAAITPAPAPAPEPASAPAPEVILFYLFLCFSQLTTSHFAGTRFTLVFLGSMPFLSVLRISTELVQYAGGFTFCEFFVSSLQACSAARV